MSIEPINFQTIRNLIENLKDPSWSVDGSGVNIWNFSIPAGGQNILALQKNTGRKSMLIVNMDSSNTISLVKKFNNTDQLLPILPQGAIGFSPIKLGTIRQCQDGIELDQDLLVCEWSGEVRFNNPNASSVEIVIYEVAL